MCVMWWYCSAIITLILLTFQLLFLRIIRMAYNPVSILPVPCVVLVALGELGCVYVWVCARAHMNTYAGMVGEVGHMGHKQFITWEKQFRANSLRPLRPVCSVSLRTRVNDDDGDDNISVQICEGRLKKGRMRMSLWGPGIRTVRRSQGSGDKLGLISCKVWKERWT